MVERLIKLSTLIIRRKVICNYFRHSIESIKSYLQIQRTSCKSKIKHSGKKLSEFHSQILLRRKVLLKRGGLNILQVEIQLDEGLCERQQTLIQNKKGY